jgi:hypothetical protein
LNLLDFIPLPLLAFLSGILAWRRMFTRFPWFVIYVAFAVGADVARAALVHNHAAPYFYVYWATEAVYGLLGICVMYEVFKAALGNVAKWKWPRLVFPVMIAVSGALTAGEVSVLPAGLDKHHHILDAILLGEIAVRFLEVLMFSSLVALVALVGLEWRQYPFGIAAGFGLYATTALMGAIHFFRTVHVTIMGLEMNFSWSRILILSYSCSVFIWIVFFSAKEKPSPPGTINVRLAFEELQLYRRFLRRSIRRK